jgi:hypothetical protein
MEHVRWLALGQSREGKMLAAGNRPERRKAEVRRLGNDQIESGCLDNDSTGRGKRLLIRVIAREEGE